MGRFTLLWGRSRGRGSGTQPSLDHLHPMSWMESGWEPIVKRVLPNEGPIRASRGRLLTEQTARTEADRLL